jgi:hypothetical protein
MIFCLAVILTTTVRSFEERPGWEGATDATQNLEERMTNGDNLAIYAISMF